MTAQALAPGMRVSHRDFGDGVVVEATSESLRVFFALGERQVPQDAVSLLVPPAELVVRNVASTRERLEKLWLCCEAHALPLMEGISSLTAAKIDLLPHQVVLTHRIAGASPRRFLIADEVGLGKTVETALILRELMSRGELRRALMVVPAGLVNNWHRELCEVFHLDFEVFGSEGDVMDRKSNAFAKHDRLIASVDTLKRPERMKRLREAPPWDLVVFDEAHHLTAYKSGSKVRRTANYKLGEVLREHTRDLLLLSATPHQGDHFRFWMLLQLLNPTLWKSAEDMVENRHRLNAVVYRRTKADACHADGSPLFARRWVHTESFVMAEGERRFYENLRSYLQDGFALAQRRGSEGRALGFIMAIFQKIAASSFAAARRTLRRRLLMLNIHEALVRDRELDIDGRQERLDEAMVLIREHFGLGDSAVERGRAEQILADLKLRLLRTLPEEELALLADTTTSDETGVLAEEAAGDTVKFTLPHERKRIADLLATFPSGRETKVEKLLTALGALWRQNSRERIVVFATYLGTVDLLGREIDAAYPGQGVVVLRGGDHGAKVAAERRFRRDDGPRVLVCTAAGREGINLQVAKVLINFDLPWNPMDVEQRIGRIHRYGQLHTAQVYNLVLSDTIEGSIFLLLEEKLGEIAKALGKVDEHGGPAEDLRTQILGQLSERLSYERLYQEALSDPSLRRTRLEIESALANASEARRVVFELFQDLDGFNLDEYAPLSDVGPAMERLQRFLEADRRLQGDDIVTLGGALLEVRAAGGTSIRISTDRGMAGKDDGVGLLGLDHPLIQEALARWRALPAEERGAAVLGEPGAAVLTLWSVETHGAHGRRRHLIPICVDSGGRRVPDLEPRVADVLRRSPGPTRFEQAERLGLLRSAIEPMLGRELSQKGLTAGAGGGFASDLIAWIELGGRSD